MAEMSNEDAEAEDWRRAKELAIQLVTAGLIEDEEDIAERVRNLDAEALKLEMSLDIIHEIIDDDLTVMVIQRLSDFCARFCGVLLQLSGRPNRPRSELWRAIAQKLADDEWPEIGGGVTRYRSSRHYPSG
jgi:hypothetical protein